MRFLHLGDLHLGKSRGDFDLIGDQKYILDQMLAVMAGSGTAETSTE